MALHVLDHEFYTIHYLTPFHILPPLVKATVVQHIQLKHMMTYFCVEDTESC